MKVKRALLTEKGPNTDTEALTLLMQNTSKDEF